MAQLRQAAGVAVEHLELDDAATVRELVQRISSRAAEPLCNMLLDGEGKPRSTILMFVEDRHVATQDDVPLRDGQTVTLMSPISGG